MLPFPDSKAILPNSLNKEQRRKTVTFSSSCQTTECLAPSDSYIIVNLYKKWPLAQRQREHFGTKNHRD